MSSSFPGVCTALLSFVTIPVIMASAERSFSKLKLIQTYLRNAIEQVKLYNLAIPKDYKKQQIFLLKQDISYNTHFNQ